MDDNPTELRSLAAKYVCIQLVYEWASCEMPAIDTWKDEKGYGTCPDHDWLIWQMKEMRLSSRPVISDLVRDQIEYYLTSILDQVTVWIRYHHEKNFFHDEPAAPLKEYLLRLVWNPCGESIDYTATARNVLDGSKFNAMEKYRFACTYCFEEDVHNLRDMGKVAINWCFETEPFLVYWSKWFANEVPSLGASVKSYVPIDVVMFAEAEKYDLQAPIEYFFARLNTGLKIWQCGEIISNRYYRTAVKYQKNLLALLNEYEKGFLYQDLMYIIHIIENCRCNPKDIRKICLELKGKLNLTTNGLDYFLEKLMSWSVENHSNFDALTPLLLDILNDASREEGWQTIMSGLQSGIADDCFNVAAREYRCFFSIRDGYDRPLEFIRVLAKAYNPKSFIKSNFHWLVIWIPFTSAVKLIDEFQLDAEDVEELRKDIRQSVNLKLVFRMYLEGSKLDDFSSFVSFCYSDDDANRITFQRNFLMDDDGSEALRGALYMQSHRLANHLRICQRGVS